MGSVYSLVAKVPCAEESRRKARENVDEDKNDLFICNCTLLSEESMGYANYAIRKAAKKGYCKVHYLAAFDLSSKKIKKLEDLGYSVKMEDDRFNAYDWYDRYIHISWKPQNP